MQRPAACGQLAGVNVNSRGWEEDVNGGEGKWQLDDRFHETAQLQPLDFDPKNVAVSKAAYDSNFGSARLD
jgi:hypothetical protein